MTLSIVIIHLYTYQQSMFTVWFKMDVLDVQNCHLSICDTSHFIYFSYLLQFVLPYGILMAVCFALWNPYGLGSVAWLQHGSPQHASKEEHSNPWNKSDFEVTPENVLLLFRCGVHSKQVHSQNLIMSFDQLYHCFLPEIHAAYPHPHPPSEKNNST